MTIDENFRDEKLKYEEILALQQHEGIDQAKLTYLLLEEALKKQTK